MSTTMLNDTEIDAYIADCAKNNTVPMQLNNGDVLCVLPSAWQHQTGMPGKVILGIIATLCIITLFLPLGVLLSRCLLRRRIRTKYDKELDEEIEIAEVPVLPKEPSKAHLTG